MPQTPDIVRATYLGGVLRGALNPQSYDRRLLKISFTNAPRGSTFTLYRGYQIDLATVMTTTLIGNRNSYDASMGSAPMLLYAGEAALFVWAGTGLLTTDTATATVLSQWGSDA